MSFVGLYLASAVSGAVAFQYLSDGGAVGASGAIFGLFGAVLIGTYPLRHTPHGGAQFRRLLLLLAINLALPLLVPGIAWEAHVGGLVAGMIIVSIWQRISYGPRAPVLPGTGGVRPGRGCPAGDRGGLRRVVDNPRLARRSMPNATSADDGPTS